MKVMGEFGIDAIQFVIPAIAFYRNNPPDHLAGLHNPITCFQRISTENKEGRTPVPLLDMNDAMGNDAFLHTIEDNISFLDMGRLHRLNLYDLSIFDGRIHTLTSRLETNTGPKAK
jgi:hypothetical protein